MHFISQGFDTNGNILSHCSARCFATFCFDTVPHKKICVYMYYIYIIIIFNVLPTVSAVVVQRLSCPKTYGIFQDQGSNPSLLH